MHHDKPVAKQHSAVFQFNTRHVVAEIDQVLPWSALFLLSAGLVFVYSASITTAEASRQTGFQGEYFLIRQTIFLIVGVVAGLLTFRVPSATWQKYAPYLFLAGAFLLAIVLIPGIGRNVNGARRWLSLGFANLQPSEMMKLCAVLYCADYSVRKLDIMHDLKKAFFPMFLAMAMVGSFLLLEPDFGALVVIVSIAMGILFLAGLRARLFFILFVGLLLIFVVMINSSEYRRNRLIGFMNPWANAFGSGYQLSHSLIAFGRGEFFGVGLGNSGASDFPVDGEHGNSRPDRSPFGFSGVRRRSFELACRVLIPQTSTALMRCRIALACNIRRY